MILFLDALALFFIVILSVIGFRRGLVEELGRLLGLVIAMLVAFRFYVELGQVSLKWVSLDVWVTFMISFIVLFFGVLLAVRFLTKLIQFLFLSKGSRWINRIMGSVFGLAKGLLVVMIFFWLAELIPDKKSVNIIKTQSHLAYRMIGFRETIVTTFNLKDPVKKGEIFIQEFLGAIKENDV